MENHTRKIILVIVSGHELKGVLRELLQDSINHLLTHELAVYLVYKAYNRSGLTLMTIVMAIIIGKLLQVIAY